MLKRVLVGSTIAAGGWLAYNRVRRWWAAWGVTPGDATRDLPGDELVAAPTAIDTRAITIDAPPEAVWPWLVQMGYGRAGWYSYDQLDMRGRSAEAIVPAWQDLAEGDLLPTHPGGGFVVRIVDPPHALVVYTDTDTVTRQAADAQAAATAERVPPGLAASGRILSSTPQQFAASWAFVLEPTEDGRTRLLERFRIWYGEASAGSRYVMPFVGFGVFVMMQKQMDGIRRRAEREFVPAVEPPLAAAPGAATA